MQNSCTHKTFLQTPAVWMVGKSAATVTWVLCTAPSTENHGRITKHRQSFWRCLRADWKRNVLTGAPARAYTDRRARSSPHTSSEGARMQWFISTLIKQTFPVLSHAIWNLILDVEMSFDRGNPVRTLTDVCSSTSHTRTEPSHDEDAYSETISKTLNLQGTQILTIC